MSLEFLYLCLWSNNVCMLFYVVFYDVGNIFVVVVVGYVDYVGFMMLMLVTGLLCMCLGL